MPIPRPPSMIICGGIWNTQFSLVDSNHHHLHDFILRRNTTYGHLDSSIKKILRSYVYSSEVAVTMDLYHESAEFLRAKMPDNLPKPKAVIICGTGLGGLAETVEDEGSLELDYASIPHFPRSTVQGHAGKLVFGKLSNMVPVVLMVGRAQFLRGATDERSYYEGHSIEAITFPIRVFKLLGVQTMIVTNAAGGLDPEYVVGDVVILNDHISLAGLGGLQPLRGPNMDHFGPRFPPLSDAYDLELRRAAHIAWQKGGTGDRQRRLHEGVYAFVGGPSYETRAECRLLRTLGADLVGMSTVPEVIVARHCGIKVLALSLVTNNAVLEAGPRGSDPLIQSANLEQLKGIDSKGRANHEEVLEAGRVAALDLQVGASEIGTTPCHSADHVQKLVSQIIADVFAEG